jgi:hypothetical protein
MNDLVHLPQTKIIMEHSVIDLKKYQRELGYGDHREIKDRLLAEHKLTVSKSAISQVIAGVYYNKAILDMAKEVLTAKRSAKEEKINS